MFVITGCGRSGTMGMARLLNQNGIRTSFEEFFHARTTARQVNQELAEWLEQTATMGEVSGFAVPFICNLPTDVVVFHQVRNPVAVIASLMGQKNFHDESLRLPNVKFNLRHSRYIGEQDTPLERCIHYWLDWNGDVSDYVNPPVVMQYRIEDLLPDDPCKVLRTIGENAGVTLVDAQAAEAMEKEEEAKYPDVAASIPPRDLSRYDSTCNTGPRDPDVSWASICDEHPRLAREVKEQAERYGYSEEDLEAYCPLGTDCPCPRCQLET